MHLNLNYLRRLHTQLWPRGSNATQERIIKDIVRKRPLDVPQRPTMLLAETVSAAILGARKFL